MEPIPAKIDRAYSWQGDVTGYRYGNTFVPAGAGHRLEREILQKVEDGRAELLDPAIVSATRVYGETGAMTGWDTNVGFVPNDSDNALTCLVRQAIEQGTCTEAEPVAQAQQVPTEHVTLCVAFDRPWPHVNGATQSEIEYRSAPDSKPRTYRFALTNIPAGGEVDVAAHILQGYGISAPDMRLGWWNQAAVLHIEVPVSALCVLFRGEKRNLEASLRDFVEADLEEHLIRTGRSRSRGPNRDWLISRAKNYLHHFVMEVGNRIVHAHAFEYGDPPIGYIDRWTLYERTLVVLRHRDGSYRLGAFGVQGRYSFDVQGWRPPGVSLQKFQAQLPEKTTDFRHLLANIRVLLKMGLHMEALCLFNGVAEVAVKDQMQVALHAAGTAARGCELEQLGHRGRLHLLQEVELPEIEALTEKFMSGVSKLHHIYDIRNDYLHGLWQPRGEFFLSIRVRQDIEELLEPFMSIAPVNWFGLLPALRQPRVREQLTDYLNARVARREKHRESAKL
jgi:hypothetical protein